LQNATIYGAKEGSLSKIGYLYVHRSDQIHSDLDTITRHTGMSLSEDWIAVANSKQQSLQHVTQLIVKMESLDWLINLEKSTLIPNQLLEHYVSFSTQKI
jgi:hypothetical protein